MPAHIRPVIPRSFVFLLRYTGYDDHGVDALQPSGDLDLPTTGSSHQSKPGGIVLASRCVALSLSLYLKLSRPTELTRMCALFGLHPCVRDVRVLYAWPPVMIPALLSQVIATTAGGFQKRTVLMQRRATTSILVKSLASAYGRGICGVTFKGVPLNDPSAVLSNICDKGRFNVQVRSCIYI